MRRLTRIGLRLKLRCRRLMHWSDLYTMFFWGAAVGVAGALTTLGFREGISRLELAWSGDHAGLVDTARSLPWLWRLAVPTAGGLLAGICLLFVRPINPSRRDYMEAIAIGDGVIDLRSTLARSVSSLLTIGSGGSIGREGSMVQLAATAASLVGRARRFLPADLRLLVGCGAAAGITSAYNAPIAGAFFVSEIVLGTVSMDSFGPLVVAAISANITMRQFPDYRAPYLMPGFPEVGALEVPLFMLLGLVAGVSAPAFLGILAWARRSFDRLAWPPPVRLGLGGLLVGLLSLGVPEVWGNGYSVVNSLLHDRWTWTAVAVVLAAKIAATAATAGSGAVGGVFTPTLFLGAASGTLFGIAVHALLPLFPAPVFTYTVVGMGAFLSAATGAPLMAILMVFEMTLSDPVLLPLSLAAVLAYFVATALDDGSMYPITGARRRAAQARSRLRAGTMRDFLKDVHTTLPVSASLAEVARMMARYPVKYVYLVGPEDRFEGAVALTTIARNALEAGARLEVPAQQHMEPQFPTLRAEMTLAEALAQFLDFPAERLPVLAGPPPGRLIGVVYKSALLDAYARLSHESPGSER